MAAPDSMTIRLHLHGIRVLDVVEDLPERVVIAVALIASVIRCSACGRKTRRVHQTTPTRVRDLAISGRATTLVWHRRRFMCGSCGATTTENHGRLREQDHRPSGPGVGGRDAGVDGQRGPEASWAVVGAGHARRRRARDSCGPPAHPAAGAGAVHRREAPHEGSRAVLHGDQRRRHRHRDRRVQRAVQRHPRRLLGRPDPPVAGRGAGRGHRHDLHVDHPDRPPVR